VNQLNAQHGAEGYFEFYEEGGSGQPVAYLMHPRGHTLEIQLQGATITRCGRAAGGGLLLLLEGLLRLLVVGAAAATHHP
jgi:hypothetical protein